MSHSLGFDIGGSSVKSVLIQKGQIKASAVVKLPNNFAKLQEALVELKNNLFEQLPELSPEIAVIGIAIAGLLDKKREKIFLAPNIPWLTSRKIADFQKLFSTVPVKIEHDVHCFLLAEKKWGLVKKEKNILALTLGTGIGGAFTINNQLIYGQNGLAGEIGHMTLDQSGGRSFEDLAASRFFRRETKKDFYSVHELARKGDKKAIKILEKYGNNLGIGLANLINIFDPEIIVLGGGIVSARKYFQVAMNKTLKKALRVPNQRQNKIIFSRLGHLAGAMGATEIA